MKAFVATAIFGAVVHASQPVCYGTLRVTETVYQTEWKLADGTISTALPKEKVSGYPKALAYPSIAKGDTTRLDYSSYKETSPAFGNENGKHGAKTYVQKGKLVDTWEQLDPNYDGWLYSQRLWKCFETGAPQKSWTKTQSKGTIPTLSRGGQAYSHGSSVRGSPVSTKRYGDHNDEATPRPYSRHLTSTKAYDGAYPTFSWSNHTTSSVAAFTGSVVSDSSSSSSSSDIPASSRLFSSTVDNSSSATSSVISSLSSSEISAQPSSSSGVVTSSSSSLASSTIISSIESSITSSASSAIESSSTVSSSSSSSSVPPAPAVTTCPVGKRFYVFSTLTERYLAAEPATGVDFLVLANQPNSQSASQFTFVFDEAVQRCRLQVTGGFEVVILTPAGTTGPTAPSGIYFFFADDFSSPSTSTRARLTCQAVSPEGGQALRVGCVADGNSAFSFLGDSEGSVGIQTNIPQLDTTLLLEAAP